MNFLQTFKTEWQLISHDAWLKVLLFVMPIILGFIIWGLFHVGIARDLPIGVVDHDNSSISRALIRSYDASPALQVNHHYIDEQSGSKALREGSIYALVILPDGLAKNTILGKVPKITAFYNSQYILIGKLVNSSLLSAHGTYVAQLETLKYLTISNERVEQAIGQALPISSQITPLFNSNTHYGQFLVTAVIPAMWQIIIMVTTVLVWSKGLRDASENTWLSSISYRHQLIKLLPYALIFWLQGIVYLSVFYGALNWPMHGSWLVLVAAQLFLVLACMSVTTLIFFITLDATRAMSLVAGFSAPAFAFMGVTFPTTDMPILAQIWRALLPISHYINLQIQQVNYDSPIQSTVTDFISLLLFLSLLYAAKLIFLKRKKQLGSINKDGPAMQRGDNS